MPKVNFPVKIRLHFIVTADSPSGGVTPQTFLPGFSKNDLEQMVQQTNLYYHKARISFAFDPTTDVEELNNTVLNNDFTFNAYDFQNALARSKYAARYPSKLVVFVRDGIHHLDSSFSSANGLWVAFGKQNIPNKFTHELGHFFHLIHIFSSEATMTDIQATIRDWLIAHPNEKVEDGLKALESAYDGDTFNVQDTPADIGAHIFGKHPCAGSLSIKVKFPSPIQGHSEYTYIYKPDRSNWMSYFESCPNSHKFSAGQIAAMHKSIENGNRFRLVFDGPQWIQSDLNQFVSPGTVSLGPDHVAVLAPNDIGRICIKVWEESLAGYWPGNDPGDWYDLGENGMMAPWGFSRNPGTLDLFARLDGGAIGHKYWSSSAGYIPSKEKWAWFEGVTQSSAVAVAKNVTSMDLFVRYPDGTIRTRVWDDIEGKWSPDKGQHWKDLGGTGTGAPAAVSRKTDFIDLFARFNDGTIQNKVWQGYWWPNDTGWQSLGGAGYDSPAVISRKPSMLELFARFEDNTIRYKTWHDDCPWYPGSYGWENLGGNAASPPVLVSRNPGTVAVIVRGIDGTVQIRVWNDNPGTWWPNDYWYDLGGSIQGIPAAISRNSNRIDLYARWEDESIRSKVWHAEYSDWWPSGTDWHLVGTP